MSSCLIISATRTEAAHAYTSTYYTTQTQYCTYKGFIATHRQQMSTLTWRKVHVGSYNRYQALRF